MTTSRLAGLLAGAAALVAGSQTFGAIMGVDLGTSAPPTEWADLTYTPFPADTREIGHMVKDVPSPLGGHVVFLSRNIKEQDKREKREVAQVGSGWGNWSHGYTGSVYHDYNFTPVTSLTLDLPKGVNGVYFFVQGNAADAHPFTVSAENGPMLVDAHVTGDGGAAGFLFWATEGDTIRSITIDSDVDFAVGEFGISVIHTPEPGSLGVIAVTGMLLGKRLRRP